MNCFSNIIIIEFLFNSLCFTSYEILIKIEPSLSFLKSSTASQPTQYFGRKRGSLMLVASPMTIRMLNSEDKFLKNWIGAENNSTNKDWEKTALYGIWTHDRTIHRREYDHYTTEPIIASVSLILLIPGISLSIISIDLPLAT